MNKEYIERDMVTELLEEIKNDFSPTVRPMFGVFKHMLIEAPAADVEPVRHGEWTHKNGEMYCSVCDGEALMDEVYYESPYCPNCGAKMDGGKPNANT